MWAVPLFPREAGAWSCPRALSQHGSALVQLSPRTPKNQGPGGHCWFWYIHKAEHLGLQAARERFSWPPYREASLSAHHSPCLVPPLWDGPMLTPCFPLHSRAQGTSTAGTCSTHVLGSWRGAGRA